MLTRTGFLGYGVFHLTVAWLALQLALGHPAGESDQSGAFQVLLRQPLGRVLLWVIIVGLAAMAVWQLLEAAVGHQAERGASRVAERLVSLGRTIVYTALAWTAVKTVTGVAPSSAGQQRSATAGLLSSAGGRALVAVAGLAVIGLGVGMVVYGLRRTFERRLKLGEMNGQVRRVAVRLGQLGYAGKGLAFAIVGILLASAALKRDAAQSTGLDGALRSLLARPYGIVLLVVIAAGFAAYGGYCFVQSKYRKV